MEAIDFQCKNLRWDRTTFFQRAVANYLNRLGHDEPLRVQMMEANKIADHAKALERQVDADKRENKELRRLVKELTQSAQDAQFELEKFNKVHSSRVTAMAEKLDGKTRKLYEESLRVHRKESSPPRIALERLAKGSKNEVLATFVPPITQLLLRVHGDAAKAWDAVLGAV